VLLGLLIAAAGVGVCILGLYDLDDIAEWGALGLVLIAFGVGLAWKMWTVWGQRILLCPGGLVRQRGLQVKPCRWEQIKVIQETEGKTTYDIFISNGSSWPLDEDHTQEIARLRERGKQHSVQWEVRKEKKAEE
jgi:hypothetical protein